MRTIIIGTGRAGVLLARELSRNPNEKIDLAGFVDDKSAEEKPSDLGLAILGPINRLPSILSEHKIQQVIVALPDARGPLIRRILSGCKGSGAQLRILPFSEPLKQGLELISLVRPVAPADLLERNEAVLSEEDLLKFFQGKTVLITGAAGSIGSNLAQRVAAYEPERLLLLDQNADSLDALSANLWKTFPEVPAGLLLMNIRERGGIEKLMREQRPSVILHAAGHKHVPMMENQAAEAVKNNVFGTRNIADSAFEAGAEAFLLLSTRLAANPSSVLGATKRIAEYVVRSLHERGKTRFSTVRLCNVLGSTASVAHVFLEQIRRGDPLTVTHPDMKRFFMSAHEAVSLCLFALIHSIGEICTPDFRDPLKILDLAEYLITMTGLTIGKDVEIKFTGLRPGECLFDDRIADPGETTRKVHKNVLAIDALPLPDNLDDALERLEECAMAGDDAKCKSIMKEMIPTYEN